MRADLIANTYELPQFQPVQTTGMQPNAIPSKPTDFSQIGPESGVAYVEGMTREYYDKWAKLKNFAQTMQSAYGIDVTKPDFSNPASLEANDIFNKALADLQFQGDQLKTSQSERTARMAEQARGIATLNVDTTEAPLSMQDARSISTSTQASDFVKQANARTKGPLYTDADVARANEIYEESRRRLTELAQEDPENADYWLKQRDMIKPAKKQTKVFAPQRENYKSQQDFNYANTVHTDLVKLSNVIKGTNKSWRPSPYKDANGEYLLENNDFSGMTYKNKTIKTWTMNPKTGDVEMVFDNGKSETINQKDVLGVYRQLSDDNRDAFENKGLPIFLNSEYGQNLLDSEKGINPDLLIEEENVGLGEANKAKMQDFNAKYSEFATNKVNELLSYEGFTEDGEKKEYTTPEGDKLKLKYITRWFGKDNFKIDNFDVNKKIIIDAVGSDVAERLESGDATPEDVAELFEKLNIFYKEFNDQYDWNVENTSESPAPAQSPDGTEFVNIPEGGFN